MPDEPITPHAAPRLDAEGRLTYIGEDGRRYVVAAAPGAWPPQRPDLPPDAGEGGA